ncbi:hypothetical protein PVAP13_5NG445800 [Panicum virgatum]|uniref:F-box domain-containing protein n=1 Tax=Panicum virgatum TaxID=38727 RepID=A0A8T0S1J4_PANVG|nr:hypothetical protein PVAP13_5NG445800 [Panicum virgatum]
MAAAGSSCLSDLSDDLLRRILFFAPAREAAATAVLSRRWRPLWRTSGAVNLDSRSYDHLFPETEEDRQRELRVERSFSWPKREAFFGGAKAALAAAEGRVKRLTFTVTEESKIHLTRRPRIHRAHHESLMEHDLLDAMVSHPAARRVEELRVWVPATRGAPGARRRRLLSPDGAPPPGAAAFPRLASLRLHGCSVSIIDLQRIVDAAPKLATLHLESLYLLHGETMDVLPPTVVEIEFFQIRCRAVTALVFADCSYGYGCNKVGVELDAPMQQYFQYKGAVHLLHRFSLKPQASSRMVRVDLHAYIETHTWDPIQEQPFWQFIQKFSTTKSLKLKLDFSMDQVALTDKNVQDEILCDKLFDIVERLELEALSMILQGRHQCKECQADFDKSVSIFRRRHRKKQMVLPGGDDDHGYDEGFGIPELREHSFSCLKNCLTRVSLHFCMMEPNCLGVQLAKFFIENAMVLEEMFLDDGSQKMCEHVNPSISRWMRSKSISRWIANSAKRRKFTSSVAVLLPH